MVFNATFNNISVISWRSVLLVEKTGVPRENHRPVASHWQTLSHNNYITSVFHWNVTIWLVMKWSHDYKRDVLHPNKTQTRTCTCFHDDVVINGVLISNSKLSNTNKIHNEKFNYVRFWCDLNVIIRIGCM